jgi:hypothetical protein
MKTTTDPTNFRFHFTVTDLARFLGKSPVTLRHWERQGLVQFPRDNNGDRRLTTGDVRAYARVANKLGRISEDRLNLVEASVTVLQMVENRNDAENRSSRSARIGKDRASETSSNGTAPTHKVM